MKDERGPWYLLTGVVIGLVMGLLYAWVLSPIQYTDTTPASLRADFKDNYRYMIALAYDATGNLNRAQARLALLGDGDSAQALGRQAQTMLSNNAPIDSINILANLSQALQANVPLQTTTAGAVTPPPASPFPEISSPTANAPAATFPPLASTQAHQETFTASPAETFSPDTETPIAVATPFETATLRPTHTPTPTPGAPFTLTNQSTACDPSQPGLLQIYAKDSAGQDAAGIELVITWSNGEEHFFTGLKPEISNGYADYMMSPNVQYVLTISNGATRVTGLTPPVCTASDGSNYPGSIQLDFQQP